MLKNYIKIVSYVQKKGIMLKFKFIFCESQQTCRPIKMILKIEKQLF